MASKRWDYRGAALEQLREWDRENSRMQVETDDAPPCHHGHVDCSCTMEPGGPCVGEVAAEIGRRGY